MGSVDPVASVLSKRVKLYVGAKILAFTARLPENSKEAPYIRSTKSSRSQTRRQEIYNFSCQVGIR